MRTQSRTPRFDAANLTAYFRARAIERKQRAADRNAALAERLDPAAELGERVHHADRMSSANSSFWILHAR